MERTCEELFKRRRSYYELSAESPVSDAQIEEIVRFALKHIPSAFNSQSTRLVLLLHEHHAELWKIVKLFSAIKCVQAIRVISFYLISQPNQWKMHCFMLVICPYKIPESLQNNLC